MRAALLPRAWAEWVGRVPWDAFWVLTFDPERVRSVSRESAEYEAYRWLAFLGYLGRRPVGWIAAVELGRGGAWHVHVLTVGLPKALRPMAKDVWMTRNGYVSVRGASQSDGAVLYSTKKAAAEGTVLFSDTLDRYLTRSATGTPRPVTGDGSVSA